jgi:thiosulfate sulfurtransferase
MNKKISIVSFILIVIFSTSFSGVMARPFFKIRSIEKTYNMIFVETHDDLLLIDVRPPTGVPVISYDLGHIPGAINVPIDALNVWIAGDGQNHLNDKIIVNCWLGFLSPDVAQILIDAGFKKVYSLEGGFAAWLAAGYPTEPQL